MGFEAAAKSGGETKLADLYLAALEFIDPRLEPGCSLEEVLAATEGRRRRLMQAPLIEVREELAALDEALHFIQRVHGGSTAVGDGVQAMISRLNAIAVVEAPALVMDTDEEPESVLEPEVEVDAEIEPEAAAMAAGEPEPEPTPELESAVAAAEKAAAVYRQATLDFDAAELAADLAGAEPVPEPLTPPAAVLETECAEAETELTEAPPVAEQARSAVMPLVPIDVVVVEEEPILRAETVLEAADPPPATADEFETQVADETEPVIQADPPPLEPVGALEPVTEAAVDRKPTEVVVEAELLDEPLPAEISAEIAEPGPPQLPEYVDTEDWVPPEFVVPGEIAGTTVASESKPGETAPTPAIAAEPVSAAELPPIRIELSDLLMPEPLPVEPEQPGSVRRKRTGPSLREVMIQAQLEAMADHVPKPQPVPDVVAQAADRIRSLPVAPEEASAVRIIKGLALVLWQAWLALFAGWTVVRLFVWPLPAWGEELNIWQAAGALALGILATVAVGRATWLYRLKTRRLLLLAHLTGALICLDLLAWRLALLNTDGYVPGPPSLAWVAALAGWPLIAFAAWLSDLRANRPAKRRN
ncbi:hypothetical protein JW859_10385 [bacterium]|nr:hypothetical protein [bacterium]